MSPTVISSGKRHGTRSIDAVSSTPLGSTRATITTVDYMLPPARESEGKKRTRRHWNREANQVRSLDLSGAAEAHAARDAEMQRVVALRSARGAGRARPRHRSGGARDPTGGAHEGASRGAGSCAAVALVLPRRMQARISLRPRGVP